MITTDTLDNLATELEEFYESYELEIKRLIARRLKKGLPVTKTHLDKSRDAVALASEIRVITKKFERSGTAFLKEKITATLESSFRDDAERLKVWNVHREKTILNNALKATGTTFLKLTRTVAKESNRVFMREASLAFVKTHEGAFTLERALKDAANNLASASVFKVTYNENRDTVTRSIEGALRANVLSTVNRACSEQTLSVCDEADCDLVETSAHAGARPEHEAWQGRIFSRSGKSDKYPPFSLCEYGSPTGICGINCRHSFSPYIEGTRPHYTKEMLDELSKPRYHYKDKTLTRYEAEQTQRGLERKVRAWKRRETLTKEVGGDATRESGKVRTWQKELRDFTKETGLSRDYSREQIGKSI